MTSGVTQSDTASQLTLGAGIARGLLDFASSRGANRAELFGRCGLTEELLCDHDNRVPLPAYKRLVSAAQELTGDPALNLHWAEAVDLADVSIVGLIMNASETMMDAFVQMQRFGRLAIEVATVDAGPRFQPALEGGGMWMVDTRPNPNDFPELTEDAFVRLTCGPRRFLPKPHILEVHFTHPSPPHRAEHDRIFQCPVIFGSRWNAMKVEPSIATFKLQLQPRYVFGVLSEHAEKLLKSLEASKTTRGRVESLLMPILHTGEITMDAIAERMALSRTTLGRRLKNEDATYEQVLDDLRHSLAVHYLTGRRASVNETAYLVGFSDPSAFSRAFKRWTGQSPRALRNGKPDSV